jgi:hypothetical protein
MNEFNPTPENKIDLERSIFDVKSKKSKYVASKLEKQEEVSRIKEILNDPKISEKKHIKNVRRRVALRTELSELEMLINEANLIITNKRKLLVSIEGHLKNNKLETETSNEVIKELNLLRNKYSQFASDHTRISSMRTMSAEFSNELEVIIRKIQNEQK